MVVGLGRTVGGSNSPDLHHLEVGEQDLAAAGSDSPDLGTDSWIAAVI